MSNLAVQLLETRLRQDRQNADATLSLLVSMRIVPRESRRILRHLGFTRTRYTYAWLNVGYFMTKAESMAPFSDSLADLASIIRRSSQ